MQAWNETNRILCQTSKKRSHDFKNHETFYLYIRFYILYIRFYILYNVTKVSHPKIMG